MIWFPPLNFPIYSTARGIREDDPAYKQNSKMVMGKHSPDFTDAVASSFYKTFSYTPLILANFL